MSSIRDELHEKARDFNNEPQSIRRENIIKENDPKDFESLWNRYDDIGGIGQMWSSMNRVEHSINYCLQLMFRNLEICPTLEDRQDSNHLERIREDRLFAEHLLLAAKIRLLIVGYQSFAGEECPLIQYLDDFRQLRNMFAHGLIHFSNYHETYYLQDRYKRLVTHIPWDYYLTAVQETIRLLFPWLVRFVDELFRASQDRGGVSL